MASKINVIEKNEGTKIAYKQSSTKLTFGDDELTINCAKYQKDWPVSLDICGDQDGNLIVGVGRYYVAQVEIPATEYIQPEATETETSEDGEDGAATESTAGESAAPEPVALDMSNVTLTLWSIDGLRI